MKLLITGARGLLGSAIKELADSAYEILAPDRSELNLEDANSTMQYVKRHQPEYCIHAAASVYGLGGHKLHPNKALLTNSKIDINLISAFNEFPIKKLVYIGTVASYGYPYKSNKLSESDFFAGTPHIGEYGYAMAKRFGYDLSNSLTELGTTVVYAVMTNLFGPRDNFNHKTGHVIPSLIARAIHSAHHNLPLDVWGDPTDTRDFLYSYSAAERILHLLSKSQGGVINIGSGIERSIASTVDIIANYLNLSGIVYVKKSISSIAHRVLDISRLELTFKVGHEDFANQLTSTIDWFRENSHIARV